MIAISPQIGAGVTGAAPHLTRISPESEKAKQSFSVALEKVTPSPRDSFGNKPAASQRQPEEKRSSLGDTSSREDPSSHLKTGDPQGSSHPSSELPARSDNAISQSVLVALWQTTPLQSLPGNGENADFTSGLAHAARNSQRLSPAPAAPDSSQRDDKGGSNVLPIFSEHTLQGAAGRADPTPKSGAVAESAKPVSDRSDLTASLSRALSGSTSLPAHNVSHPSDPNLPSADPAQPAAKSAVDKLIVPTDTVPPPVPLTVASPAPADGKPGSSKETAIRPASDRNKTSTVQDSAGAARKNTDMIGVAKALIRKDDTLSYTSSETGDHSTASPMAKASEASPFGIGTQPPMATGDGKNASTSLSSAGNGEARALDQDSAAAADGQAQAESALTYPLSLVQSAKLVERAGSAELRLGIRAGEFGSVDIRTSMVRNQFTAEISAERLELSRVLAAELSTLQDRLAAQRVSVANVTVLNHTGSHSTSPEQQNPRDGPRAQVTTSLSRPDEGLMPVAATFQGIASVSRLDIHM